MFNWVSCLGVYTIDIDAEEGTVKVSGDVNPSTILRVLEDSGCYAELKSVRFHGKIRERDYYYEHNNGCLPPPYSMVYTYSAPRGPDYEWFNGTNYPFIIPPLPWQPQSTPSLAMPLPLPAPPQTLAPPPQLLPPNPPPVSMAMAPGVADVQKGSTAGCSVM